MKQIFSLVLVLLFNFNTHAQLGKEAWHWQFGRYAALDFTTGIPVVGSSPMITDEGSASISDSSTGQLLFYTDGVSVWDKNNNTMPNGTGLTGNASTTQSALIIPKPGSTTLYYIITCDDQGGANGVRYSEVDMSLNSGLGDVVFGNKNSLLTPAPTTEKLVGIKHCNGHDYWIIDHTLNSTTFNAYKVTSAGIQTTPVTSSLGIFQNDSTNGVGAIGYLKASPNGRKLAQCISLPRLHNSLELFDFDAYTGKISHPLEIKLDTLEGYGYGASFSPDNSKVYFTTLYARNYLTNSSTFLFQFDLSSNVDSLIIASKTTIINNVGFFDVLYSLQMAPDGKIYGTMTMPVGTYAGKYLNVIANPNALGLACNFQEYQIALPPTSDRIGLPNFIDANSTSNIFNTFSVARCSTNSLDTLRAAAGLSNYMWSTGDTTSAIIINSSGTYWVEGTIDGCLFHDTIHVTTVNPNTVQVLHDTTFCTATGDFAANANFNGAQSYQWYDGTTNPIKNLSTSGTYSVVMSLLGGCDISNSFNLVLNQKPNITLGNDTFICGKINPAILLNAGGAAALTYSWSTGSHASNISVTTDGTYWVKASSAIGCNTVDTVHIISLNNNKHNKYDTVICHINEFPVQLIPQQVPGNHNHYFWNGGNQDTIYNATHAGTFVVEISVPNFYIHTNFCLVRDTFNVSVFTPLNLLNDTTVICTEPTLTVDVTNPNVIHYLWNDGFTLPTHVLNAPGTYYVTYKFNNSCLNVDSINVNVQSIQHATDLPNVITPNGDNINDYIDFGKYGFATLNLQIFNRWGLKVIESDDPKFIWKPTVEDGTYFYVVLYYPECKLNGDPVVLKGFFTIFK